MQEKQEVEHTTVGFNGYNFLTIWSEEKGCYTTRVMQRPDLITEGDTAVGSLVEMEYKLQELKRKQANGKKERQDEEGSRRGGSTA